MGAANTLSGTIGAHKTHNLTPTQYAFVRFLLTELHTVELNAEIGERQPVHILSWYLCGNTVLNQYTG